MIKSMYIIDFSVDFVFRKTFKMRVDRQLRGSEFSLPVGSWKNCRIRKHLRGEKKNINIKSVILKIKQFITVSRLMAFYVTFLHDEMAINSRGWNQIVMIFGIFFVDPESYVTSLSHKLPTVFVIGCHINVRYNYKEIYLIVESAASILNLSFFLPPAMTFIVSM